MQPHKQRTWFTLWKRLKKAEFPLYFISPTHSVIKHMRVLDGIPAAQVSILKLMEWQGRTDDDSLSPFTLELAGWRRALPMCKLEEQRCQTRRDDCPGLLKALKPFSPQSVSAGCEELFALLALNRGVGIAPSGSGLLTRTQRSWSASWPQQWRCCAAQRLPEKRNEEKDTPLQPGPHSKCN